MGAAVLFLQLFHNDGAERPANIDQGQEISSGIYGMGQFYRNWHPRCFPPRYPVWYLRWQESFTLSYRACQTQCNKTQSSTERGDCIVSLQLWLRHLISLNLSSFICKMRKIIATLPPSQACDVELMSWYIWIQMETVKKKRFSEVSGSFETGIKISIVFAFYMHPSGLFPEEPV